MTAAIKRPKRDIPVRGNCCDPGKRAHYLTNKTCKFGVWGVRAGFARALSLSGMGNIRLRLLSVFTRRSLATRGTARLGALVVASALLALAGQTEAQVVPGAIAPGRDRPGPAVPTQPDFD